ncbi:MAG: PLP-dependent aminotransferase family protein [Proteobacteria bacterium]|nr:PLP-dependent aminotransferase family protein [Pseudomonadota bacterium]MBU1610289.1 PLP-dependent aminotransferase family protein [Pseudomonadota bacterium]
MFRYQVVENAVIALVESGALGVGEKVPSLRTMATRMGVSLSTVSQAYLGLEAKGIIESRPRSGFFLRESFRRIPLPSRAEMSLEAVPVSRNQLILMVLETVGSREQLPYGVICPSDELLPGSELAKIMIRICRERPAELLRYETVEGSLDLRRQLAFRSLDAGFESTPGDYLITSGCLEALYISLRVLTRPGDTVLVQSPTYYCFLQLLESLGLRAVEVPSCPGRGIDPDDVARALDRFAVSACIFSPNYNNPDGSLTPEEAKKRIVELLAARSIPLVEDDIASDLHFGPRRPGTFKQYDREGTVILCSSFSKTAAPGYRVGWMTPGRYREKALEVKATTSVSVASPGQMVLAEFLASGRYDRHLKRLRAAVALQMRTLRAHVGEYFPAGTRATDPDGGAVLWLELPPAVDGVAYFHRAREAGIGVAPGAIFTTRDDYANCVRLSAGGVWDERMKDGLRCLGEIAFAMATQ